MAQVTDHLAKWQKHHLIEHSTHGSLRGLPSLLPLTRAWKFWRAPPAKRIILSISYVIVFLCRFSTTLEAIGVGKIDFAEAGKNHRNWAPIIAITNGTHVYGRPNKNPLLLFSGTGTWDSP